MPSRWGLVGAMLAVVAGVGSAAAADLSRYQPEDRFGDWQVLCDSEDDMASITHFDCVVRSATEPAIVLSSLADGPAVSLADGATAGHLDLSDQFLDFDTCPEGLCPLPGAAGDIVALLSGATVTAGDRTAALSADGLGDALDLALRLPD